MTATETTPAVEPEVPSTDLVPHGLGRLQRRPIFDSIEPRTLALIRSTIAQRCSDSEIGHFLELCAHYDLDPFAKEAWCAKNKSGSQLLIMVGRDGLRKVAHRQGLHVDADVVRDADEYAVEVIDCEADAKDGEWAANGSAPFHRVTHKRQGMGSQRGTHTGAWARVKDARTGRECGWFEAPLEEYMPSSVSDYSPWKKQVGVMILAAAERQAIRQATPLGGLMAIGEDEVAFDAEATAYEVALPAPDERIPTEHAASLDIALGETGWTEDEKRMHLAAVGAQDVSMIPVAVAMLTPDQAAALLTEINAAVDAATAEAQP